jgi:GTPase SAR1 family protein
LEGQPFDRSPWAGTLGVNYKAFAYEENGVAFALHVWDMAGEEKFHAIVAPFYRATKGLVLCYAINARETFARLTTEFVLRSEEFFPRSSPPASRPKLFLLGCKSDAQRAVSLDEARSLARSLGATFLGEVSSATRNHIDDAFLCVAHHIYRKCSNARTDR